MTARLSAWPRPALIGAAALLLSLLCAGLSACGGPPAATSSSSPAADAVVTVNGRPVTRADIEAVRAEARLGGTSDAEDAARAEAVRRLLVRAEAERLRVTVEEAAVASHLAGLEERAGGAERLDTALERAAMSRKQLAAAVKYGLLAEALAAAKFPASEASPAAVRAFYRRNRAALFTTAATVRLGKVTLPTRSLAAGVARRLRGGEPFTDVARRFTMDRAGKESGGMLGWISVATLPAEVRAALAGVSAGGVSEPVRSFGKWQVFKVFARRRARVESFAAAAPAIAKELTRRRRAAALGAWVKQSAADAAIVPAP